MFYKIGMGWKPSDYNNTTCQIALLNNITLLR